MSESATKLNAPAKSASILDEIYWDIKHGDETHQKWLRERLASFEDKLANALIAAYGEGLDDGVDLANEQNGG